MSAPNIAYLYGTTPSTGGYNALVQAITSAFLGVNTEITTAISATGSQSVTPLLMTNIGAGTAVWINWGLSDQECVSVTSVTGTTFTATFSKTHAANMTVTCGLPSLGVVSPWTNVGSLGLTKVAATFVSSALTAIGDNDYIPILVGQGSTTNTIGFASGDDVAITGTGVQNVAGYYTAGAYMSTTVTIQDTTFSWWLAICEFSIVVVTLVGSAYSSLGAGSFRTIQPLSQRGVGTATTTIAATATTVTVTPDISSRISAGQHIYIVNNSHDSSTANWNSAAALMTVLSVSGNGSQATLNFTAGVPHSFDPGALVGMVPIKYSACQNSSSCDQIAPLLSRNLDGTWTSYNGQTAQPDAAVITSDMTSYESPSNNPNTLFPGELDIPVVQTGTTKGACGFFYCVQEFGAITTVSNQDAYGDASVPAVWKAFKGVNIVGLGPILNPLNTQATMTPLSSTPFVP